MYKNWFRKKKKNIRSKIQEKGKQCVDNLHFILLYSPRDIYRDPGGYQNPLLPLEPRPDSLGESGLSLCLWLSFSLSKGFHFTAPVTTFCLLCCHLSCLPFSILFNFLVFCYFLDFTLKVQTFIKIS